MIDKTKNPAEIYLVLVFDGEHDHVWCDTPAPGEGMREEDATRYVREDIYLALQAQVEQLENELTLSTDQNDLLLDEFVRVKLLTDNAEIHGLCERAHLRMRQKVSVIDRNMMLEQKVISLKRDAIELAGQVELLQDFLAQAKKFNPEVTVPDFLMRTGKSIAEIKAQAVEEYCASFESMCVNQLDGDDLSQEMIDGWKAGIMDCRIAGRKYANQLRQQAKAGE